MLKQSSSLNIRLFIATAIVLILPSIVLQMLGVTFWVTAPLAFLPLAPIFFMSLRVKAMLESLSNMKKLCNKIKNGDLESRLPIDLVNFSEIADLRLAINGMIDTVDGFMREATYSTASSVKNKFYRVVLERGMHGTFKHASSLMNKTLKESENKNKVILSLVDTSESGINSIAASTEEASSSINEISQQVNNTVKITDAAKMQSDFVAENIKSLLDNLERTSEIMGMIQQITGQTNLLALNASIEAARAGEAGKGFSVVADEVRKLANETDLATQQVAELMESVQKGVNEAYENTNDMGKSVSSVNENITSIAAAIEQQNIAIEDIYKNSNAIIGEITAFKQ